MADTTIHPIDLQQLTNDANFQIHTETSATIAEFDAGALHLDDVLLGRYAAQLGTLDTSLKKIVKSPNTKLIQEADKKRDETYRGFVAYVKAMCLHYNPSIRAAAERVRIVADTYKNVVNKSYEEETSAIYNMVQDLKSAKYAADVALINATQWVDTLGADNAAVSALIGVRDDENAAKTHINTKEARTAIDHTYKTIIKRVNSHAGEDATPTIAAFVTKMNIIVKRFNTLVKQHHSHHHHHGTHGSETTGAAGTEGTAAGTEGNEA